MSRAIRPRLAIAALAATLLAIAAAPAEAVYVRGIELKYPDGTVCRILLVTGRETAKGAEDLITIETALLNAWKASQDMKDKVKAACAKWNNEIPITVLRDEAGFDGAGVPPDTGRMVIDIGDFERERKHVRADSAEAIRDYVTNDLSATIAHEFEHLKDGPGEANHRDPEESCWATTRGPAVDDENTVMAQMMVPLARTHYIDLPNARINYTYGQNGSLVRLLRPFLREVRQLPKAPQEVPQAEGDTTPPGITRVTPPPANQTPPGSPTTPDPPSAPDGSRNFPQLDDIPFEPCGGERGSGCYPVPALPTFPRCATGFTISDPKVYGAIGGAVLGGILIAAGGSDTPTVTGGTPTVSPQPAPAPAPAPTPAPAPAPTPEPTPAPTPAPPPRTTADGRYRCVAVRIVNDEGRHNSTINLGPQLTGDFDVREGNGTITIRHPAPFVDIVNAQFDPVTGRFSGTAVGGVAGSPNVGVRAEGTVNTTTGQIVFTYTMGTGGELPGGRPIVYEITLQKQ